MSHADAPPTASASPRWYKGNLHTHSLWSDGDDFPERIAAWYRDNGYQFLGISDHNTIQTGEKWVRFADLKKRGAAAATRQYLKDFADLAKTRGDTSTEAFEIRLSPFADYAPKFDRPGEFLMIPSEEISDKFEQKPIHMNATNIAGEAIKPQGGSSVVEVIRNNLKAAEERSRELNRPILVHLNHPNFKWGVTAEEIAEAVEERFFEVFNGHPIVYQEGDATHPSIDRIWDIANTLRVTAFKAAPLFGVGTDDSHNYHVSGMTRATSGRGWVCVRAKSLSAADLIAAMKAGDFYASSGVVLSDVRYDAAAGALKVSVAADGDAKFVTRFIGTLAPDDGKSIPPEAVGVELAKVEGRNATYKLTGKELYVRAQITSDQTPANPCMKDQKKQAWTQPVGWEKRVK
ncbi:PHP domain-containing protein [Humisphaera borealis]|uniref:Polymerase/histidinol phosphatase N-terminal domain-containing protein n=1 Tax=Humisphaera borealis TaxID=2807512 RepID=A0A7M2WPK7_9BACT|nr:hypothetical protein [Humisphaera borealis]QOV87455.1 hypothetical protein IPV69_14275 [Humisphaera borealis]